MISRPSGIVASQQFSRMTSGRYRARGFLHLAAKYRIAGDIERFVFPLQEIAADRPRLFRHRRIASVERRRFGQRDPSDPEFIVGKRDHALKAHLNQPVALLPVPDENFHPLRQIIGGEMVGVQMRHQAEIDPRQDLLRRQGKLVHRVSDVFHTGIDRLRGKARPLILQPGIEQDRQAAVSDLHRSVSDMQKPHTAPLRSLRSASLPSTGFRLPWSAFRPFPFPRQRSFFSSRRTPSHADESAAPPARKAPPPRRSPHNRSQRAATSAHKAP